MDNGSGGTVDNVFDQSGWLTIANPGADKEQSYTYDAVGNLTSVTSPNVPWYNRVFGYDALNRLEHAEGQLGGIDYTYHKYFMSNTQWWKNKIIFQIQISTQCLL